MESIQQVGKNTGSSSSSVSVGSEAELKRAERALLKWHAETAGAALAFESRWTWLTLRRIDPDIGERLFDQRGRFARACITGTADDIAEEGAALCRGYAIAAAKMVEVNADDDAYIVGRCPRTGTQIAISRTRATTSRVRELFGAETIWVTPDEIAMMFAPGQKFGSIGDVKRAFPGAEITDRFVVEDAQKNSR